MVQENHQEKLKIITFQYTMLTHFISLNMNDPVHGHGLIMAALQGFRWIPWCQMEVIFVCLSGIDEDSVELA